jgi:hypothetical protein
MVQKFWLENLIQFALLEDYTNVNELLKNKYKNLAKICHTFNSSDEYFENKCVFLLPFGKFLQEKITKKK